MSKILEDCFGEYQVISRNGKIVGSSMFPILEMEEGQRIVYLSEIFYSDDNLPTMHFHSDNLDAKVKTEKNSNCSYEEGGYCHQFIIIGNSVETISELVDFVESIAFNAIDIIDDKESFAKFIEIMNAKIEKQMDERKKRMEEFFGPTEDGHGGFGDFLSVLLGGHGFGKKFN